MPTFAEQGVDGIDMTSWIGFFGPGNQPPAITIRLNVELQKILAMQKVSELIRSGGNEPAGGSPEDFARAVRDQSDRWGKVIRHIGLKLD